MPTIITRGAGSALALISSQPTAYTFSVTTYNSPYGNGVYTPYVNLYTFFTPSILFTGKQFQMTGQVYQPPGTSGGWSDGNQLTSTFTIGTAATQTIPNNASKQFYVRNEYDGGSQVRCYGFYSGNATSFPNGSVSLVGLAVIV